jgi:hypothetical protein
VLGGEDEAEAAIALFGESLVGFLGHMRRMIIEDDLDSRVGTIGGIKLLEEADELARTMAIFDAGVNLSREQVDACQQTQCPPAFAGAGSGVCIRGCVQRTDTDPPLGASLARCWQSPGCPVFVLGDEREVW